MRSLVWLSTLCLVTAAVATVATVEYRRRCGLASCTRSMPPACVLDLHAASTGAEDTLPEPLRGLQIMSAQSPRTDLASEISPETLEELAHISEAQVRTTIMPTSANAGSDEFTCPRASCGQTVCEPPAVLSRPTCQSCGCAWQRCLTTAVNEMYCCWQTLQRWVTSCRGPVEPPRLPGLMANVSLPAPMPSEPVRSCTVEMGSQAPFFSVMQVVLGTPIDDAMAEALCQLFQRAAVSAVVSTADRVNQALALAAWNAELVDDGNAVVQAAFTALEPEHIEVANLVVVTRFYPVTEVMAPGQSVEQFIAEVCQQVAPRTWERQGGLGTVVYFAPSRTLVIRQTPAVHTQLEQFFSKRRQPLPQPGPTPSSPPNSKPKAQVQPQRGTLEFSIGLSRERGVELEIVVTNHTDQTQERGNTKVFCQNGATPPCPEPRTPEQLPTCLDEPAGCPEGGCQGCTRPKQGGGTCSRCPCQDQRGSTASTPPPQGPDARMAVGEEGSWSELTQVHHVQPRSPWWNFWSWSECPRHSVGIPACEVEHEEEDFFAWPPQGR